MIKANIYGRDIEMQGSPLTLLHFHSEFGGGLASRMREVASGTYDRTIAYMQIAWAMCKTFDPSTQPFDVWLGEFDPEAFNLADTAQMVEVVDSAINAELFRGEVE